MAINDFIHPDSRRVLAPYFRTLTRCTNFVQRHPAASAFTVGVTLPAARLMADLLRLPVPLSEMTRSIILVALLFPMLAFIAWPLEKYPIALRTSLGATAGLTGIGIVNTIIRTQGVTPVFPWTIPAGTLFVAATCWIAIAGYLSLLVYLRMRFWPRYPIGHCQRCGYNLFGLQEARCPECGTGFDVASSSNASAIATEE